MEQIYSFSFQLKFYVNRKSRLEKELLFDYKAKKIMVCSCALTCDSDFAADNILVMRSGYMSLMRRGLLVRLKYVEVVSVFRA